MSGSSRKFFDSLESRTLMSTTPVTFHPTTPTPPDATIAADRKAVQAAETALAAAWKASGAKILADQKALATAINTAYTNLPASLTTQLKTHETTVRTDLSTPYKDFAAHASSTQITADKTVLQKAQTAVRIDETTIHTDVFSSTAVVAAQKQLTTDSATVVADQKAVQAALKKLFTDWKNHA